MNRSSTNNTERRERRAARLARRCARIVLELRAEGQLEGAHKIELAAIEACDLVRKGAL